MSIEAVDSDNEDGDGVLDNQLAELKRLNVANEAINTNKAGELSEFVVATNAANEADDATANKVD